jgi:hypothetical protein
MVYQLNYGIEYLGLGNVMYYKYAYNSSSASTWYVAENKEVLGRNIGLPPACKYANYRTVITPSFLRQLAMQ